MNHTPDTIPTSIGVVTPAQLVDELTYSNFAYNRDRGMSAEAYASMFRSFPTAAFEARYQREVAA